MTPIRTSIEIKQGVRTSLLLTPALYGCASARGIDLSTRSGEDAKAVIRTYTKIAYCAAINAWEVDSVDDPGKGEFPYSFADFDAWAWSHPDEVKRIIDAVLVAFTGKTLKESVADGVKKKTRAR